MARISVEDRSRQFIEAAARVIAAEGIVAATTRRIAAEADAPLAALHYCFRSKDDLLNEVYNYLSRDYARELEPMPTPRTLEDAVDLHIRRIWRRMLTAPHEQITTFELLLRSTRLDKPQEIDSARVINRSMYAAWIDSTSSILAAAAQAEGRESGIDLEMVSRIIIAGIDGISLQHVSDPDVQRSEQLIEALCTSVKALLGPRTHRPELP